MERILKITLMLLCIFAAQTAAEASEVMRECTSYKNKRIVSRMYRTYGNVFYLLGNQLILGYWFHHTGKLATANLVAISYTKDKVYVYNNGRKYSYDQDNSIVMGYLSDINKVSGCIVIDDDYLNLGPQHWGCRINVAGEKFKYQGPITYCDEIWKDAWLTYYGNELTHLVNADLKKCYSEYPHQILDIP